MEATLEVNEVIKYFGGIAASNKVSFKLSGQEILGIIGPNGAGKTTLVNLISGMLTPNSGRIYLNGKPIDGLPPYEIARRGIGRTFQITQVFKRMTVLENMLVPAVASYHAKGEKSLTRAKETALEVLSFLTIDHLKNEFARNLSGGQQKLLELGRVLMLNPDLIILDEPFAGVHPQLVKKICEYILSIYNNGKSFIIVSHDMTSLFSLSHRVIVLSSGEKIADNTPEAVKNDQKVIDAYLGDS